MMWGFGMGMHWNMVIMLLINLLVIYIISFLGYLIFRRLFQAGSNQQLKNVSSNTPPHDALSILKERYVRGEITREEYLRIREDLKQEEH